MMKAKTLSLITLLFCLGIVAASLAQPHPSLSPISQAILPASPKKTVQLAWAPHDPLLQMNRELELRMLLGITVKELWSSEEEYAEIARQIAELAGQTGDHESARQVYGLPLITHVEPGSPADDAGIQSGDRLMAVGRFSIPPSLATSPDDPGIQRFNWPMDLFIDRFSLEGTVQVSLLTAEGFRKVELALPPEDIPAEGFSRHARYSVEIGEDGDAAIREHRRRNPELAPDSPSHVEGNAD